MGRAEFQPTMVTALQVRARIEFRMGEWLVWTRQAVFFERAAATRNLPAQKMGDSWASYCRYPILVFRLRARED